MGMRHLWSSRTIHIRHFKRHLNQSTNTHKNIFRTIKLNQHDHTILPICDCFFHLEAVSIGGHYYKNMGFLSAAPFKGTTRIYPTLNGAVNVCRLHFNVETPQDTFHGTDVRLRIPHSVVVSYSHNLKRRPVSDQTKQTRLNRHWTLIEYTTAFTRSCYQAGTWHLAHTKCPLLWILSEVQHTICK